MFSTQTVVLHSDVSCVVNLSEEMMPILTRIRMGKAAFKKSLPQNFRCVLRDFFMLRLFLDKALFLGDLLTPLSLFNPFLFQNESEKVAHDSSSALKKVQIHGPAASIHQTFLPCSLSLGAPAL